VIWNAFERRFVWHWKPSIKNSSLMRARSIGLNSGCVTWRASSISEAHWRCSRASINKYLKTELLIIDDMGPKVLPQKHGEILLEIIMRRHENRSTLMTPITPSCEIIPINGRSYRLQPKAKQPSPERSASRGSSPKSGINGASLRATLHLFRFDLDPREAPARSRLPYFAF